MENEDKALVFYVKPWRLTDEKTGQLKEGVTVEYIMTGNLCPVVNEDGSLGFGYAKQSMPYDKLLNVRDVPGYYNLDFGFRPNSKGKMEVKLLDLEFIAPVSEVQA